MPGSFVMIEAVILLGALLTYLVGAVDEVGLWRLIAFGTILNNAFILRINHLVLRHNERLAQILGTIRAIPAVRCAGCHLHATKLVGPVEDGDGDDAFLLPPGWGIRHERPYCQDCLASGAVGW
jgi:hypothetical protein